MRGVLPACSAVSGEAGFHTSIYALVTFPDAPATCLYTLTDQRAACALCADSGEAFVGRFQPIEMAFWEHKSMMRRWSGQLNHNPNVTAESFVLGCWEHLGTEDPEMWKNFVRSAGYIV